MTDKAHFLGKLYLEDMGKGLFMTTEPLGFYSAKLDAVVQAPAGLVTDLASIPPYVPGWLVPKLGDYDYAAIIHDAAYKNMLQDAVGNCFSVNKHTADALFREGMEARGVNKFKRWAMWRMVSIFGKGDFGERCRKTSESV